MPKLKMPTTDVLRLTSTWTVDKTNRWNAKFATGPTTAQATWTFTYNLASGAKVKKAQIKGTIGTPRTGISIFTANGSKFSISGNKAVANIKVSPTSTSLSVTFVFKANGNTTDTATVTHSGVLTLSDVCIEVDYQIGKSKKKEKSGITNVPPQTCCIYDKDTNKVYLFDGVIKIQHQLTNKLEEEPSKNKEMYVNNAKGEPDKVTLEVMMSDVYTGKSALDQAIGMNSAQASAKNHTKSYLKTENSRSANALAVLKALKEKRNKLAVITPQIVYTDMLIASIVSNQDETCPFGWSGQIVFQRAFEPKKENPYNSKPANAGDVERTPANQVNIWGDDSKV